MELLDVVRLRVDLPDKGLRSGDQGAIVEVFEHPRRAYEVEFVDEQGRTQALCTLMPDQLELVWRQRDHTVRTE